MVQVAMVGRVMDGLWEGGSPLLCEVKSLCSSMTASLFGR